MSTLKDVAERAGVTVTTVSRVINNRGYISEKTRKKVFDVIEEIGYHPNEVARSLSKRHTNMFGVIVPRIDHPYYSMLVGGLEAAAAEEKCKILLCCTNEKQEGEKKLIELFEEARVSGIILCVGSTWNERSADLEVPVVVVGGLTEMRSCSIQCDNYEGGELAADCLIRLRCKSVAYIEKNEYKMIPDNMRRKGFIERCREKGVKCSEITVTEELHCAKEIACALKKYPDTDGIFTGGDLIAAEALKACAIIGKKVPEDVNVIGFGDTDAALLTTPTLTSIRQPVREMACLAVKTIVKKEKGEIVPNKMVLPVKIVERGTTGQTEEIK